METPLLSDRKVSFIAVAARWFVELPWYQKIVVAPVGLVWGLIGSPTIVGVLLYLRSLTPKKQHNFLTNWALRPNWQKRGLGLAVVLHGAAFFTGATLYYLAYVSGMPISNWFMIPCHTFMGTGVVGPISYGVGVWVKKICNLNKDQFNTPVKEAPSHQTELTPTPEPPKKPLLTILVSDDRREIHMLDEKSKSDKGEKALNFPEEKLQNSSQISDRLTVTPTKPEETQDDFLLIIKTPSPVKQKLSPSDMSSGDDSVITSPGRTPGSAAKIRFFASAFKTIQELIERCDILLNEIAQVATPRTPIQRLMRTSTLRDIANENKEGLDKVIEEKIIAACYTVRAGSVVKALPEVLSNQDPQIDFTVFLPSEGQKYSILNDKNLKQIYTALVAEPDNKRRETKIEAFRERLTLLELSLLRYKKLLIKPNSSQRKVFQEKSRALQQQQAETGKKASAVRSLFM